MEEKRTYHALRSYIDALIDEGAQIVSRSPFSLRVNGRLYRIQHGMMVSYGPGS